MILIHIREHLIEAYIQQGWQCRLLLGWHGAMRRFIAELRL